jgi:hypothetical protein
VTASRGAESRGRGADVEAEECDAAIGVVGAKIEPELLQGILGGLGARLGDLGVTPPLTGSVRGNTFWRCRCARSSHGM